MNEKTFLNKIIKKYSKKFETAALSGTNLKMNALVDLRREIEYFINNQKEELCPKIEDDNDPKYLDYYKTIQILYEYFKMKEKIYFREKLNLKDPKRCELYNL